MIRLAFAILSIYFLAANANAQPGGTAKLLDPEAKEPYRWRVALHLSRHPVFSGSFREQLGKEIRAALQSTHGAAGEIEIVDLAAPNDPANPMWKAYAERGWAALDPSATRELNGVKTHILKIDYRDGAFQLEAKQYDGFCGIASPLPRKQTTRSSEMLSRVALLLLEPDFGPVGTVEPIAAEPENVMVTLRGHSVAPMANYVKMGDIFAVSVVRDERKPTDPKADARAPVATFRTGVPFPYTLLKVIAPVQDGACKCVVLTRWRDAFGLDILGRNARRRVGLRCIKLPTKETHVQLRLVGLDGSPHPRGSLLSVAGTDLDFAAQPAGDDLFAMRGGVYKSARTFTNVACISISVGAGRSQQFPIPVLSDEPIVLKFEVKQEEEDRALFANEVNAVRGRVSELVAAQVALFSTMNSLIDGGKNRDALSRAEDGLARADPTEKSLADEVKQLRERPLAADETLKKILDRCDAQLGIVRRGQKTLTERIEQLKERALASADPAKLEKEFRAKELAARIKDLLSRGDVPEALEAYDQLINLVPEQQDLKDTREKLLAEWTPKDDEHRKSRDTLRTWQAAKTVEEFRVGLATVKAMIEVFTRKRDSLGMRRLLNSFEPTYAALNTILQATEGTTEEGAKTILLIEDIVAKARLLEESVREFANKIATPEKK